MLRWLFGLPKLPKQDPLKVWHDFHVTLRKRDLPAVVFITDEYRYHVYTQDDLAAVVEKLREHDGPMDYPFARSMGLFALWCFTKLGTPLPNEQQRNER